LAALRFHGDEPDALGRGIRQCNRKFFVLGMGIIKGRQDDIMKAGPRRPAPSK
jgi:hypothetical protein